MKNFNIHIAWKENDLKQIDDKAIEELKKITFSYTKEHKNRTIFEDKNVYKTLKKSYKYGLIGFVLLSILCYIVIEANSGFIGQILLMFAGISALGLIFMPFSTYSHIIFEIDNSICQSRILKKNVLGITSSAFNLDYPNPIGRIVLKSTDNYYYITFRESFQDKISESAPIMIVKKDNHDEFSNTMNLLEKFIKNSKNEITLVNL